MTILTRESYKQGKCKLQSGTSSLLCLTSHDGGSLMVQSATTGEYIQVDLDPGGLNQELFNNTCVINGVENKSASPNTLYSVYVRNLSGNTYKSDNRLELWETKDFLPTLESQGFFVANTGGPNVGLMYVGLVYTGNSNISTILAPGLNLRCPVYSHFNPWAFGFQTTTAINSNFTQSNNGVQNNPSIFFVTEGLMDCPLIIATVNFYSSVSKTFEVALNISGEGKSEGTAYGPWNQNTQSVFVTAPANSWQQVVVSWMSAPPTGHYTAKPIINMLNSGTATVRVHMLGHIPY